jgi:hypothetical protein
MTQPAGATAGTGGAHIPGTARPLVLPETFDRSKNWDEWVFHFESVAEVNGWDDAAKLRWLRVRVTGRAQKALHLLPETSRGTYAAARAALKARFDPESRHTRYQAEFQARRKKATEGWADFADDLKALADKGYRTLPEEAREQLAINAFLQQLAPPQVAFSVKQKRPGTEELACCPVSETSKLDKLTRVVEQLTEQVGRLQSERRSRQRRTCQFAGECWKCQQPGHMARDCPQLRTGQQGN